MGQFRDLLESSQFDVKGIRELKKYKGKGYVVISGYGYTRGTHKGPIPAFAAVCKGMGTCMADMFYEMKHEKVDYFSIERAIQWVKDNKEVESGAKGWKWEFTLIKEEKMKK